MRSGAVRLPFSHLSYENLSSLLHKCLKSKPPDSKQAKQIHALLSTSGAINRTDLSLDSKLVGLYAGCGDLRCARLLFVKMPSPNIFAFNWMVSAMAFHGNCEEAIRYFAMIQMSGYLPNKFTFSIALKACVGLLDLCKGKEVHAMASAMGLGFDVSVSNALIDMYCKCGKMEYACRVFDRMSERDVASWTAIISGYCNCGMIEESLELFERMKSDKVQPNNFTWNSIMAAYAQRGDSDRALLLFRRMERESSDPDLVTWNALISGFAKGDQAIKAIEIFKEMIANGVRPNCVTITGLLPACGSLSSIQTLREIHGLIYRLNLKINIYVAGALIDIYAKCGSVKESTNVFEQSSVKNVPVWNAIIGCHAKHGLVSSALELFEEMQRQEFRPNEVTMVCVLSACSHGGLVEKGMELFRTIEEKYGVEANEEHYACVVDLLCRAGRMDDAYQFLNGILTKVKGGDSALGAFFNGCRIHGRRDLAKQVALNLARMGRKKQGGLVTLSNIHAADGEFDEVVNLRMLMKEKDVHKRPGFSSV